MTRQHVRTVEGLRLLRHTAGWVLVENPGPTVRRPAWRDWAVPSVQFLEVNGRWTVPTRPDSAKTLTTAVKRFKTDLGLALGRMFGLVRVAARRGGLTWSRTTSS